MTMQGVPIMSLFAGVTSVAGAGGTRSAPPYVTMGSDASDDQPLLDEYVQLRTKVFGRYLTAVQLDELYYRLEFGDKLIPPEWRDRGLKPVVPPTADNAAESAANNILTTPDILVPERPGDEDVVTEQAIAAVKASALSFFWHQIFKQGDPLSHAKKDLIKHGKIVLKKEIDFDNLNTKGVNLGRTKFPWRVRQISPTEVFEDPSNPYDPEYVYEAYKTVHKEAIRLFPGSKGRWRSLGDPQDHVRVLEYWEKPNGTSRGRRVVWIEDERVLNKPNPYHWLAGLTDSGAKIYDGYVPYFIADSGWGDGDAGAMPHDRYVGIVRRVHSLMEAEAQQLTMGNAELTFSVFPILDFKNIEEDDEHPLQIGPGAKIHTNDDQSITPVAWPPIDPSLFTLLSRVHEFANELVQFQTLSGTPQPGVNSATEADQNFRAASTKLSGPISGLKSIITRMNETVFQDIENVLESPVTFYGAMDGTAGAVTIQPEWIGGFYENFVELKTSDQRALDAANAVRWANLYQTFGLDKRFAMKMAGIPNPQQRIALRLQEDVWFDPRMHEMRVANALRDQGGEFGEVLSQNVLDMLLAGTVPPPTVDTNEQPPPAGGAPGQSMMQQAGGGGGSFAAPPFGTPSNRQPNGAADVVDALEPQPVQRNAARAIGFNHALMMRPDLYYGGSG